MMLCRLCNNILPNGGFGGHGCGMKSEDCYVVFEGKLEQIAQEYWDMRHVLEIDKKRFDSVKKEKEYEKLKIKVRRYRYLIDQLMAGVSLKKAKRNWKY